LLALHTYRLNQFIYDLKLFAHVIDRACGIRVRHSCKIVALDEVLPCKQRLSKFSCAENVTFEGQDLEGKPALNSL
jgi:hypothetical protein